MRRRAAEQRDELAPPIHSITSSARSISIAGIFDPSALAVLRLMTSSNLVGNSIGTPPVRTFEDLVNVKKWERGDKFSAS